MDDDAFIIQRVEEKLAGKSSIREGGWVKDRKNRVGKVIQISSYLGKKWARVLFTEHKKKRDGVVLIKKERSIWLTDLRTP